MTPKAQRLTLIAMILASGIVFLDSTVVNVALPAIDCDLIMGLSGLPLSVDGYISPLAAFLMVAGSWAERDGRKTSVRGGLGASGRCARVTAPWLSSPSIVSGWRRGRRPPKLNPRSGGVDVAEPAGVSSRARVTAGARATNSR